MPGTNGDIKRKVYVASLKKEIAAILDECVNDEPYWFTTRSQAAHYFLILGLKSDGLLEKHKNRGINI
jgi:hypothetical protein